MAHKKRRPVQHIMEAESYHLIQKLLPREWVIREFNRPDYGIDLVIEVFEKVDGASAETLGEFIFVQVKSVQNIEIEKSVIYPVQNVAKGSWKESKDEWMEIDVVKYVFDTNSLYTIQSLGGSVAVLLFLADLPNGIVYFICLNDYIEKILLPSKPAYADQDSVRMSIPTMNKLNDVFFGEIALTYYSKREKLLAAFSKFAYQKNELGHSFGFNSWPVVTYREQAVKESIDLEEFINQILYFIDQIQELDIWDYIYWKPLPEAKKEIAQLREYIGSHREEVLENPDKLVEMVILTWHRLTNLNNMYEEICREWYLPKYISLLTSYPLVPEIHKRQTKA